jgi:outer membrane lipoprotein-sorting protein
MEVNDVIYNFMENHMKTGIILAGAAAALLASGFVAANAPDQLAKKTASVKCMGVNSCKHQGSCKSTNNACKHQNSCKGKGWVHKHSAEECTKEGGTVVTE